MNVQIATWTLILGIITYSFHNIKLKHYFLYLWLHTVLLWLHRLTMNLSITNLKFLGLDFCCLQPVHFIFMNEIIWCDEIFASPIYSYFQLRQTLIKRNPSQSIQISCCYVKTKQSIWIHTFFFICYKLFCFLIM